MQFVAFDIRITLFKIIVYHVGVRRHSFISEEQNRFQKKKRADLRP